MKKREVRWKPYYTDEMKKLHALGFNDSEIAARMNDLGCAVTRRDVQGHRTFEGLVNNAQIQKKPMRESVYSTPKERPNPVAKAEAWLGKRLVIRQSTFFLDGIPVNLDKVMKATNEQLAAIGAEQINCNPRWVV